MTEKFDESKHPRVPAGGKTGGQFTAGGNAAADNDPGLKSNKVWRRNKAGMWTQRNTAERAQWDEDQKKGLQPITPGALQVGIDEQMAAMNKAAQPAWVDAFAHRQNAKGYWIKRGPFDPWELYTGVVPKEEDVKAVLTGGEWTKDRQAKHQRWGDPPLGNTELLAKKQLFQERQIVHARVNMLEDQRKLQAKKEAMDRFLEKQRAHKAAAHEAGMPGPETIKKLRKLEPGEVPPAALAKKMRKLDRVAHGQGKQGWRTLGKQNAKDLLARMEEAVKPKGPGPATRAAEMQRLEEERRKLVEERHQRHMEMRKAKAASVFRRGKNVAAKRHNMKVAGKEWHTPPPPMAGVKDTSGKFEAVVKRGVRGNRLIDAHGNNKITWKLIPTEKRGEGGGRLAEIALQQRNQARDANAEIRHGWEPKPETVKNPIHISTAGIKVTAYPPSDTAEKKRAGEGIFLSARVKIDGDGDAILKSNGYKGGDIYNLTHGFAYREVAAYQVDQLLGLNVVPLTETFEDVDNPLDKDHGTYHSIQHFVKAKMGVEINSKRDAFNSLIDKTEVSKTFLLDAVMGNPDRHAKNWMVGEGHFYAIDNGLQMAVSADDPRDVGWRCDMKDYARTGKRGPAGHSTYPLSSTYKLSLRKAYDSGTLQKIVDVVTTGTKPERSATKYSKATMDRAKFVLDNWDDFFSEPE